jgi:6-phospho-beta-glucosidase
MWVFHIPFLDKKAIMKLTFIGAGGVRTPLVIQSILNFQDQLPLDTVCMMDIDPERLDLIKLACKPRLLKKTKFNLEWTTDARKAIKGADFIVTTFREGSIASRVIDEQVPLKYGVLGQETTGPGGFAMALRTIPIIIEYVNLIRELAPNAWLINFTNPAGIITETITRVAGFERAVGICDNPANMMRGAAQLLKVDYERLFPDYYGINHLGWMRALYLDGVDMLPKIFGDNPLVDEYLQHIHITREEIAARGALPNEYNYFYYHPRESVDNLVKSGISRAMQIQPFNEELYSSLARIRDEEDDPAKIHAIYLHYLDQRHGTYMSLETGRKVEQDNMDAIKALDVDETMDESAEGYSAVALNVIKALTDASKLMILNVPNHGAIPGLGEDAVVETTCLVSNGVVRPFAVGEIPAENLALLRSVKAYEQLTIQAAVENSYDLALKALTIHPLVPSFEIAKSILDDYLAQHGDYFPKLK